jgi:hypothetical protein
MNESGEIVDQHLRGTLQLFNDQGGCRMKGEANRVSPWDGIEMACIKKSKYISKHEKNNNRLRKQNDS